MSQKRVKQARKQLKKHRKETMYEVLSILQSYPLLYRIRLAIRLVFGKLMKEGK